MNFVKSKKFLAIVVLFFMIFLSIIFYFSRDRYDFSVIMGRTTFKMEVADTRYLQEKGLSHHKPLEINQGMIFIFSKPDKHGFWMKDMDFPIDIIWVGSDFKIKHIEKWLMPESYPKVYYPEENALYVIEVNAGVSDYLGIKIGDSVVFKNYKL